MKLSRTQKAVLALIVANIIWGAAAPIFKWSLESVPPFTMAFLRFAGASVLLLPFVYRDLYIQPKHIIPVILNALLGVTVSIAFFFLGLMQSSSINAPIIHSSGPIFLLFLGVILLREKVTKREIIGGLLGLLGVIFIVITPIIDHGFDGEVAGNLFFILSMVGNVLSTIILKKIIKFYKPVTMIFWSFLIGGLSFIPFLWSEVKQVGFLPVLDFQALIGIAFGIVLCSALAFYLHNYAVKFMAVGEVGIFTYIDPIIAVLIAIPLLHEYPTPIFFFGSLLVFLGIYIAEGRIQYHPIHKLRSR